MQVSEKKKCYFGGGGEKGQSQAYLAGMLPYI